MANNAIINFLFNSQGALKELENFKTKFSQTTNAIKNSFVGNLGAVGTAIGAVSSIKKVYDETKKLADFSLLYNTPVEQVSKFANVLSQFGGSTSSTINQLTAVEEAISNLRLHGGGALKELATTAGISMMNIDGSIKSAEQIITDLRDSWGDLNDYAKREVLQKLNIFDPSIYRYLSASNEELQEASVQASKFGVITQKSVDAVNKMDKSLAIIKQSFLTIGISLLGSSLPIIEKISQGMEWLASQSEETRTTILGIVGAIGFLSPATRIISGVVNVLSGLLGMGTSIIGVFAKIAGFSFSTLIGGLNAVFGIIGKITALLLANPIMLGIAAIIAGVALIIANWDAAKEYFNKFVDWMGEKWNSILEFFDPVISKIKEKWDSLKDYFTPLFDWLADSWNGVKNWINDVFSGAFKWINKIIDKIPFIGKKESAESDNKENKNDLDRSAKSVYKDEQPAIYKEMLRGSELGVSNNYTNDNRNTNNYNTNKNTSNNRYSVVYNVNFYGIQNPDDMQQRFNSMIRQNSGGVLR